MNEKKLSSIVALMRVEIIQTILSTKIVLVSRYSIDY